MVYDLQIAGHRTAREHRYPATKSRSALTALLQAVRNDLVPHAHIYVAIDDGRRHPPNRGTQTGAGIKHPTYIRCVICMKSTGCRIESPNDAIRIVI